MKIKVFIVEDELLARQYCEQILKEMPDRFMIDGAADNVEDAICFLTENSPDIIIVDIMLNGVESFKIFEKIDSKRFHLIFTTAFDKFALKAIKQKAFDYLLKPIDPNELKKSLIQVAEIIRPNQNYLLKTSDGTFHLNYSKIIRFQADGNYCKIFLKNGKSILISKTLKSIEESISSPPFIRVHNTHVLNANYILKIKKFDLLILTNKQEIPISRKYRYSLRSFLESYGE